MKINSLTKEDALRQFVSSEEGLSEFEAAKRLFENGPNDNHDVEVGVTTMDLLSRLHADQRNGSRSARSFIPFQQTMTTQ